MEGLGHWSITASPPPPSPVEYASCFQEARLLSVMRELNALEWELSSVGGAGAVREDVALQRWAQLMGDHRKRVEVRRC